MTYNKIKIYTDGGARGNPGPAGAGAVIKDEKGETIKNFSRFLGEATNNQAEYQALILGLEKARDLGVKEIDCFLDSELLVNQLNHEFKVKDKDLAPLFIKVWNLSVGFRKVKYHHIFREDNREADRLVNEAIDRGSK
jgi:ribonuclease HI